MMTVRAALRAGLVLVVVLAAGWWLVAGRARAPAADNHDKDPIPVLVASVAQRDVPIYLDGLGTVQASATVTVKAQVDGVLTQVLFREGQDVRTGDVLARIDPRTYKAAVDQAVAKKAQDLANLANARVDMGRYSKLAATAYTSAQQADTQRATVAQLEAQVAQDQAQIDTARAQLSYTTIVSPIDGRTGIRQVDQGNIVHAADTGGIVVITTLRPIAVVFTLPQQQLPDVAAAQARGEAEVLALPQGGAADAAPIDRGALAVLDNQVDATTGTIKLKAMFPNARLALWPGAFVTVRLKVETRRNAVVVPPVAVQRGPAGTYVYVVGDDQTATRRMVAVDHEDLAAAIVSSGLRPGERVVVDGAARLTDHAAVKIVAPQGAPPPPPVPPTPATASRPAGSGAT
jgi:multidrug efflux system membrane fusion protein